MPNQQDKKMNFNSILLAISLLALGWVGTETRLTHDAVLRLQYTTVSKETFELKMKELEIRLAAIEQEQARNRKP